MLKLLQKIQAEVEDPETAIPLKDTIGKQVQAIGSAINVLEDIISLVS